MNIGEIIMNLLPLPQFGFWPADGAGTVAVAPPGLGEHGSGWLERSTCLSLVAHN